jgi:hypothetical protein
LKVYSKCPSLIDIWNNSNKERETDQNDGEGDQWQKMGI